MVLIIALQVFLAAACAASMVWTSFSALLPYAGRWRTCVARTGGSGMMYCSQWFTFEIPDAWWDAAGMRGFKTDRKAYRRSPQSGAETIIMLVDSVGVDPRGPGIPTLEQYRMISVLRAIRLDRAMSPIEVTKASGQGYTHALYHGYHRLAASIAVGYPLVPTVIRRHYGEIKRTEGVA